MNEFLIIIFQLVVFLFSVMIHEVAHGAVALKLGDTTAKDAGRLTLNPLKHLDFFGSILLPLSLYIISQGSFILGWAKPVPYNPYNLKNPKKGAGLIAAAGPLTNITIAVIFGILIRIAGIFPINEFVGMLLLMFNIVVFVNVLLAIFNLLPLPPLDGSGILFSLLPEKWSMVRQWLQRYGFYLLFFFIFFGFQLIIPVIMFLYRLIVGSASVL
ncbi:MAG: site-2 protease family protein [bacterium]|nr:site-2 protease family protein [bacterium]